MMKDGAELHDEGPLPQNILQLHYFREISLWKGVILLRNCYVTKIYNEKYEGRAMGRPRHAYGTPLPQNIPQLHDFREISMWKRGNCVT
jgi:hypothetical protein